MLFSLPVIDLSCLPQEQRLSQAEALVKAGEQQAFDLERGPLLRASLLRLEANVHVLLLSMHHIISDAWSLTILRHEIFTLYDALSHEKPAPLVPLALQYADFALWQRQWLQGDVLQGHLDYWQKQLRGAVPVELPADHQRPLVRSLRGATLSFRLPANLSSALLALSRSQDVTLFMTLLAAFQILLSRYTGQTDIVVGTDIANRTQIETEQMIGFFINLLALRTRLHGMPTFHSLLHQVRDMVLDAYTHQDLPFDMLVDSLQLVRQRNQTPLVQVLFVLQNTPHSSAELPGLQLAPFGGSVTTAKFDIALFMWEGSNGLGGMVNYSTDLFEESTISTLVERFTVLLQEIVAQPDALIETLGIATPEEKRQQHRKVSDLYSANRKELHISRGEEIDLTSLALWMDD